MDKKEQQQLERVLRKVVRDAMQFVKRDSTPMGCIIQNPYCECRKGQQCKLLPDD